jgi:hypothetical protein
MPDAALFVERAERQLCAGETARDTVSGVARRFRGSVMVMAAQRGSGLGSIEVRADGVTLRTAFRRVIEIERHDITRIEVKRIRNMSGWRTNFYFVRGKERARHYFVALRTSALRSALTELGYAVVDVQARS